MNKNLNDKIIQVEKIISNSELVKQYNFYHDLLLSAEELKQLNNELKFIKKCNMSAEEREKYLDLQGKYKSHPIVCNYNNLKNEIEEFKTEVKNILKL